MDTYKIAIDTFLAEASASHFKTSSCIHTGTSQSCISWPDTPCFPSPLPVS